MFDQLPFLGGMLRQRYQPVADQVGRGLVAGVEQEDAIVQQLFLGQPLAIGLALDQARQHVALGIAGPGAAAFDQCLEIGEEVLHGVVAARERFRTDDGLQRAQDRQRPVAQRLTLVMRHVEQIADHLDRDRGREIADQLEPALILALILARILGRDGIEQPLHQRDQVAFHLGDRARRQRSHDQPPHAGMRGRIVEDKARGVVLVEQGGAVFRRELLLLVG